MSRRCSCGGEGTRRDAWVCTCTLCVALQELLRACKRQEVPAKNRRVSQGRCVTRGGLWLGISSSGSSAADSGRSVPAICSQPQSTDRTHSCVSHWRDFHPDHTSVFQAAVTLKVGDKLFIYMRSGWVLMCCMSKLTTIGNISLGHFKVFRVKNTTRPFKKYSRGPVLTVGNSNMNWDKLYGATILKKVQLYQKLKSGLFFPPQTLISKRLWSINL